MCQMRVVMEKDSGEEMLFENVTSIDVLEKGLAVTTLFEGAQVISGSVIRRMDFLAGKIILSPA